ncbi:hypothetical protein GQ42DRAFT_163911 [Ramicandelaber brevisporus]|nr:hypothetical protein GQ42DRAFT_163911 [Ramicandelaber brevisporus]
MSTLANATTPTAAQARAVDRGSRAPSIVLELFSSTERGPRTSEDQQLPDNDDDDDNHDGIIPERYHEQTATDQERIEYLAKLNRNTRRKFIVVALGLLLIIALTTVFAFTIPDNASSKKYIPIPWAVLVVLEGVAFYFYKQEMKVNSNTKHFKDTDVEHKIDRRKFRQAEIIAQQVEIERQIEQRNAARVQAVEANAANDGNDTDTLRNELI